MNLKDVLKDGTDGKPKHDGSTQDLKVALNDALSESISKLNPQVAKDVDMSDQIELVVKTQMMENKEKQSQQDIKYEQYQKYM